MVGNSRTISNPAWSAISALVHLSTKEASPRCTKFPLIIAIEKSALVSCFEKVKCFKPKELSFLIHQHLKTGISYPRAREMALMDFLGENALYKQALNSPNNILGIEYLKALKKYKSSIKPITIKREYSDHNSTTIIQKMCQII